MAQTHSPMRSVEESPSGATGSPLWPSTLIRAMSVSGSAPTTRARSVRPSDSLTMIRSARSMTWLLVRMLPSPSMMNPLPAPRRGESPRGPSGPSSGSGGSIEVRPRRRPRSRPRAVASMFTTAGLMRSTMSAKLTRPFRPGFGRATVRAVDAVEAVAVDVADVVDRAGAPADTAGRAKPPATIAPTRNATTAVSTTVTTVKRLDMFSIAPSGHPSHYKVAKLFLVQDLDAESPGLLQFAAGITASDEVVGFLAHRPRHFGAQTLERLGGLLARHRHQRSGEDDGLAGQRSGRLDRRLRQTGRGVH